jgi:hypothetical protein
MRPLDDASRSAISRDAAERLGRAADDLEITEFIHSFPSTSCGFPGIGGQAFTDAPVTVAISPAGGACVYVGTRLAYHVKSTNDDFQRDLADRRLIQAAHYEGQYDEEPVSPPASFCVRGSARGVRRGPHALDRAIDEAYMIANYGLRGGVPRTAEVLVDGTDTVVCRVHPAGEGETSPTIERLEAIEPFTREARFPRVKVPD